jgi:wobble nucleotide-excising tRNase
LAKLNSPAEPIDVDEPVLQGLRIHQTLLEQVERYNQAISEINSKIDLKKQETSDANPEKAQQDLNILLCTRKRFEESVDDLCSQYSSLKAEEEELKNEKTRIKQELDDYSAEVLTAHEEGIRRHLAFFGAQFYPTNFQKDHSGGKPGFNFEISINNTPIKLGGANTPEDSPCFSNTLSEGDKQSLAFAFFLSKLDSESELANKIVVFDDPICSLDSNRREYTRSQILRIARTAKQVILLSHDPIFLKAVAEDFPDDSLKLFKIKSHSSSASEIELWNIVKDTQSRYFQDFQILCSYLTGSITDELMVATRIRPFLETNLRTRFPDHFPEGEWLGDFIGKLRRCSEYPEKYSENHPLLSIHEKLDKICSVNDYSKRFHHSQEEIALINSYELRVHVELALGLIR